MLTMTQSREIKEYLDTLHSYLLNGARCTDEAETALAVLTGLVGYRTRDLSVLPTCRHVPSLFSAPRLRGSARTAA